MRISDWSSDVCSSDLARSPAAVMQRMIVCHSIVDLIMGALAEAIPERVMGDSCGCLYNYCMAIHPRLGRRVMFGEVVPGGIGATPNGDGLNVLACHVPNCHIPPIEASETESPVRERKSVVWGTGVSVRVKTRGGRSSKKKNRA